MYYCTSHLHISNKKMGRSLVFLLCLIVFAQAGILTDEQKEKIIEYNKECMKETHVDLEVVMKAANGEYAEDEKLKKQILCFNKKVKVQNDDGEINMDVARARLVALLKDEKKAEGVLKKCVVKKDTPEITAFEAAKCMHKLAPDEKIYQ